MTRLTYGSMVIRKVQYLLKYFHLILINYLMKFFGVIEIPTIGSLDQWWMSWVVSVRTTYRLVYIFYNLQRYEYFIQLKIY